MDALPASGDCMFVQVADCPLSAISNWLKCLRCLGVAALCSVVACHKITFLNVEGGGVSIISIKVLHEPKERSTEKIHVHWSLHYEMSKNLMIEQKSCNFLC